MKNLNVLAICVLLSVSGLFVLAASLKGTMPAQTTEITKDGLKKLLGRRVESIDDELTNEDKADKLFLVLRIVRGGAIPKYSLNGSEFELAELTQKLKGLFKGREMNGLSIAGTNVIDKRITLPLTPADIDYYHKNNVYNEDFEKLVDALHDEGMDQIFLCFVKVPDIKTIYETDPVKFLMEPSPSPGSTSKPIFDPGAPTMKMTPYPGSRVTPRPTPRVTPE